MYKSTKTVLIVDDDRDVRQALARVLAAAGFVVLSAKNLVEACEQLQLRRPDVVFLDLELGSESGDDFAFHVDRAAASNRPIPIVVISGVQQIEAHWRATQIAAAHCIEKPCDPARIVRVAMRAANDEFLAGPPRPPARSLN